MHAVHFTLPENGTTRRTSQQKVRGVTDVLTLPGVVLVMLDDHTKLVISPVARECFRPSGLLLPILGDPEPVMVDVYTPFWEQVFSGSWQA